MKKYYFPVFLLFISFATFSQSKFQDGYYGFSEDPFKSISNLYEIEGGKFYSVHFEKGIATKGLREGSENEPIIYQSTINRNNAIYTWINANPNFAWTETQILNMFYVGNPYIYIATHKRFVNNNDGMGCFDSGGACFDKYTRGYVRLAPFAISKEIHVGGSSDSENTIDEVRITKKTIEVALTIHTSNGYINPPSHENAYVFIDKNGAKHELLAQYGWKGDGENGFGSYQSDSSSDRKIILFFENNGTQLVDLSNFSLKEGVCSSGCWNFYDVRVSY